MGSFVWCILGFILIFVLMQLFRLPNIRSLSSWLNQFNTSLIPVMTYRLNIKKFNSCSNSATIQSFTLWLQLQHIYHSANSTGSQQQWEDVAHVLRYTVNILTGHKQSVLKCRYIFAFS